MNALRKFRLELGLTHKQMAEKIGIRRVKYTKIELGYYNPNLEFIRAFSKAFNLTAEEIERIFIAQDGSDTETHDPTGTVRAHSK